MRLSLRELELPENAKKKNDFLKAWKMIQELPPSNPNSFWSIATYHGMPFKERAVPPLDPSSDIAVWGGYCQHANVLFPTWHRFYLLKLEQALQTVLPDGDVALHYWDETSEESLKFGIPEIALNETVVIDGEEVDNPLKSFTIPLEISGHNDDSIYKKPAGYTTVRYPYSGIMNPQTAFEQASRHNKTINAMFQSTDELLQDNFHLWLTHGRYPPSSDSVFRSYELCLEESDYNRFSNTTSSEASLEQPHNDVHIAVGGLTTPTLNSDGSVKLDDQGEVYSYGLIEGANGDLGENETSAFDPMFFIHHCNVDRMFWIWQKKWDHTESFSIHPDGPNSGTSTDGTNNQGITPDQTPDEVLGMDTILDPFQDEFGVSRTSRDCINIENLGYTYSIGSFDKSDWPAPKYTKQYVITEKVTSWQDIENKLKEALEHTKGKNTPIKAFFDRTGMPDIDPKAASFVSYPMFRSGAKRKYYVFEGRKFKLRNLVTIKNLHKNSVIGSFTVQAYYQKEGKLYYIGQRGILNRWNRKNCANCQKHQYASVSIIVDEVVESFLDLEKLLIEVIARDPMNGKTVVIKIKDLMERQETMGKERPQISFVTEFDEDINDE